MTLLIITIIVLLLAVSLLLFAPWGRSPGQDRNEMNRAFYHARLQELEQDNAPASNEQRARMVEELQQNLLQDIPDEPGARRGRASSRWAMVPAVLLLAAVSIGVFMKTSDVAKVREWQVVTQQTPALMQRVMDPNAQPLNMEEMARLGLGLRTRLQDDPTNVQAWQMLGRIGMVLNNASTATNAFERAWRLAPDNASVKLDYAEVLTRSADPEDNQQGGAMLREMLRADHTNIRVLSLLAFNAFEQKQYREAIGAWQIMLRLLPVGDERRGVIERSIAQAKVEAGIDNVKLAVTITLTPEAKKNLPEKGMLFVSVTDGESNVPVAAKKLPLSRFPLSLTLDDTDAMMPNRSLSGLHRGVVKVHISQSGRPEPQSGDWLGESATVALPGQGPVAVEVSRQQP
ncbi:c-type cytochrome biogenesis protein CcmI [Erwinia sp. CPCC 100877]|nr:c-type cytochrome biogenesis protein CcmI [Erwinia sp. CPCC 100877]